MECITDGRLLYNKRRVARIIIEKAIAAMKMKVNKSNNVDQEYGDSDINISDEMIITATMMIPLSGLSLLNNLQEKDIFTPRQHLLFFFLSLKNYARFSPSGGIVF